MAQDPIALLELAVDELRRAKGPSIVRADSRDVWRSKAWAKARELVAQLERSGLSRNAIAREMNVDPSTLHGWLEHGNTRREQVPAWALEALEDVIASTRLVRSGTDG